MLLSSCEDYLDKSPDMGITDKEVFQNYLSYRGVLDKVYVLTCDPFLSTHGGGRFAFGDEGLCTAKGTCHRDLNDGNFMLTKDNLELGWYTSEAMNSVATNKMPIIAAGNTARITFVHKTIVSIFSLWFFFGENGFNL